jgi:CrcB protein
MKEALWVGVGGFVGANARYFLGVWVATRLGTTFPYGTFIINSTGSFILGLIMGILEGHVLAPAVRLTAAIGFVGAYTTFSTWTYETLRLIENGSWQLAAANAVGSLLVGIGAAIAGITTGRAL